MNTDLLLWRAMATHTRPAHLRHGTSRRRARRLGLGRLLHHLAHMLTPKPVTGPAAHG
ncbi:hypothetical protein [Caenispirillum salinarum]|uniref:hypothetical protein n=1 Tax=Caenispirillum salinarum TaxID=859058 RepID=UPI00384EB13F